MKFWLLIAALLALVVVTVLRERIHTRYVQDRARLEWQAAKLAENTLAEGPVPTSWDTGFFVSNAGLRKLSSSLEGTTLAVKDSDLTIVIDGLSLKAMPTFIEVDLNLKARSAKRGVTLQLNSTAELVYAGTNKIDDKSSLIEFRLIPILIDPHIGWMGFDFRGRRLASDLLATGLLPLLLEHAQISLPMQTAFSGSIGGTTSTTIDVNKNSGSTLTYRQSIPEFDPTWNAQSVSPLILSQGLWLLASSNRVNSQSELPDPGSRTHEVLESETSSIRTAVSKIAVPSGEAAIWLSSKPLLAILNQIAQLPSGARTISIQSTKADGPIADQKWHNDILGDGETSASFDGDDAVSGQIVIGNVSAAWAPGNGLSLEVDVNAHANAKVKVHIDPGIGGGLGTSVGLAGDATTHLAATLSVAVATIDGSQVLAIKPSYQCNDLSIDLETDDKTTTDFGWMKIPSLGIIRHQPMDLSVLKPELISDDLPTVIDSRDADGNFKSVKIGGQITYVEPSWRYLEVSISPSNAQASDLGWMITGEISVLQADTLDSSAAAAKRNRLRNDTKAFWPPPSCGGDSSTEVKLGPLVMGPNNKIVKFFGTIEKLLNR